MKTINLQQGSTEWHAHRQSSRNASDAPAMMGASNYKTRQQLLAEKATGITPEVSAQTQALFDRGHAIEAFARPIAERIVGDDLFPVIGVSDDGYLSASFDGITMDGKTAWECKTYNKDKADFIAKNRCLPDTDYWQVVQQFAVSGAERVIYMLSDGTEGGTVHLWVERDVGAEECLVMGWQQFDKDVADYVPEPVTVKAVATPTESLPAVVVQVQGSLAVAGNLDIFGAALKEFVSRIPSRPETDQDFADAEAACKSLKKAEDALKTAEESALAQISDVEQMRRMVADLSELARTTRLRTEKLVKAEKENRKLEKITAAKQAFAAHVSKLQADVPGIVLRVEQPDFAGAIKGLSSLSSIDNKLSATLVETNNTASITAGRVRDNLDMLNSIPDYAFLFADKQELVYKEKETLEMIVEKRVADHKQSEARRIEQERQRIEAEATAKAEREAKAVIEAAERKAKAEEEARLAAEKTAAKPQAGSAQVAPAPTADASVATENSFSVNAQIRLLVASHFGISEAEADKLLLAYESIPF